MDIWAQILDQLRQFLATSWARDVGLLLAAMLVAYLPARAMSRRLRARFDAEPDVSREERILRVLADASLWPLLAIALLLATFRVLEFVGDESFVQTTHVVPLLLFFLAYRLLIQLASLFVPSGERKDRLRRGAIPIIFALAALQQLGLVSPLMGALQRPLLELAGVSVSPFSILSAILVVFAFAIGGRLISTFLGRNFLPGLGIDRALSEAIGTIVRYLMIVLGFMVGLAWLGFDLTTVQIAFGALGVGIGFGLQNITSNFMSGLILLFERSVKRGDVLTTTGVDGRVTSIGLRASVMRTRGGDDIIVPNSLLVSERVTNYSFGDRLKRVEIAVGVEYGSDPHHVRTVLLQVAEANSYLLQSPAPSVMFKAFGESELSFELRGWIDNAWKLPEIASDLRFGIWDAFLVAGIRIPFPQRDLHLKSGFSPEDRIDTPS